MGHATKTRREVAPRHIEHAPGPSEQRHRKVETQSTSVHEVTSDEATARVAALRDVKSSEVTPALLLIALGMALGMLFVLLLG